MGIDEQSSEINRLKMQGEDYSFVPDLVMGSSRQLIRELLATIENLLIALEVEADYPGERTREEIANAKAIHKECVDLGLN
jgi:tRNA U34 5-carboxymethylaminomethyl modifying GTPase MnmE/TrmE